MVRQGGGRVGLLWGVWEGGARVTEDLEQSRGVALGGIWTYRRSICNRR